MLIRYFRSSFPGQFVTVGVVGLLLWGSGALHPPPMPAPDGPLPLYTLLYDLLSGLPYLAMAAGFLLVVFQAIWLNYILLRHNLVPPNTALAALLFLLFSSLFPAWLTITPVNITTFFLLFILQALMEAYNQTEPIELIYTSGFFVALASFFYFPSLFLYGFLLVSFLVYRSLNWREWLSSLIGMCTPVLYLLVVYFMTDRLPVLANMYVIGFRNIDLIPPVVSRTDWVPYGLAGLLTVAGVWDTFVHFGEKTVEVRRKSLLLVWLLLWVVLMNPYSRSLHGYHAGLLSICLAAFVGNFYLHLRKPNRFEFLLWLLILILFANTLLTPIFLS